MSITVSVVPQTNNIGSFLHLLVLTGVNYGAAWSNGLNAGATAAPQISHASYSTNPMTVWMVCDPTAATVGTAATNNTLLYSYTGGTTCAEYNGYYSGNQVNGTSYTFGCSAPTGDKPVMAVRV